MTASSFPDDNKVTDKKPPFSPDLVAAISGKTTYKGDPEFFAKMQKSYAYWLEQSNRVAFGGGTPISLFDLPVSCQRCDPEPMKENPPSGTTEPPSFLSLTKDSPPLTGICVYSRDDSQSYIPGRLIDVDALIAARRSDAIDRPFASLLHPASTIGPLPQWKEDDDTLVFESRFESGNLRNAVRVKPRDVETDQEYDLAIDADTNSAGCTQWFYLSVENCKKNHTVKFNFLNFAKQGSLVNSGMRPLVCCVDRNFQVHQTPNQWTRDTSDVSYIPTGISRSDFYPAIDNLQLGGVSDPLWIDRPSIDMKSRPRRRLNTLSFSFRIPSDDLRIFFSLVPPYPLSRLKRVLKSFEETDSGQLFLRRATIGRSLAGNLIECLTITNSEIPDDRKRFSIVTARTHPGETMGSWAMEGLIDFLLSKDGENVRNAYIWKIIPMMNPDGVVEGNYRCSLAGTDLNRVWLKPDPNWHPEVFAVKKLISKLKDDREIAFFGDLHGHSQKLGWFSYGCLPTYLGTTRDIIKTKDPARATSSHQRSVLPHEVLLMPYLLGETDSENFVLRSCSFGVSKDKVGTARVVVNRSFGVQHCFTLEASFGGVAIGNSYFRHYTEIDYKKMGACIAKAMETRLHATRREQSAEEIRNRKSILDKLATELGQEGESDSEPGEDLLDQSALSKIIKERGVNRNFRKIAKTVGNQKSVTWDEGTTKAVDRLRSANESSIPEKNKQESVQQFRFGARMVSEKIAVSVKRKEAVEDGKASSSTNSMPIENKPIKRSASARFREIHTSTSPQRLKEIPAAVTLVPVPVTELQLFYN